MGAIPPARDHKAHPDFIRLGGLLHGLINRILFDRQHGFNGRRKRLAEFEGCHTQLGFVPGTPWSSSSVVRVVAPRLGSFFQMDLPPNLFFPRRFTMASIGRRFVDNLSPKVRLSGPKGRHLGGMKAA
jgi:hypothetical protein